MKLIIAGTAFTVSVIACFCYSRVRDLTLENLKKNALLEVQLSVDTLDQWIAVRKAEVAVLAANPIVTSMDWSVAEPYLQSEIQRSSDFHHFVYVNPDGSFYNTVDGLVMGKNIRDRLWVKKGLAGEANIYNPMISRLLGIPKLNIAAPIGSVENPVGVLSGGITTDKIFEVVSQLQYGKNSYAFALNSDGKAIVHPQTELMSTIEKPAPSLTQSSDLALALIAKKMVNRNQGIELVKIDNTRKYVAYIPLKEADWSVALVIPRKNIESQLQALNLMALIIFSLGGTMLIVLLKVQSFERKQLQKSKEIAETANLAKSNFLSNMSHELRTPLNGILGYAQILKRDCVVAQQTLPDQSLISDQLDGLNIIYNSGQHLLTLINDILDLSKIEAGKMELYPSEINLASFIENLMSFIDRQALEKNITLQYVADQNLPLAIEADEKRLRQILFNLLGNAIKFTHQGQVKLRISRISTRLKKAKLRFEIIDTGVGMNAQELQKIFQPFEQVGEIHNRADGTGLGLNITQQLIEMMGGQLHVESTSGQGSTFWFDVDFPIVERSTETQTEIKDPSEPTDLEHCATMNIPPQAELDEFNALAKRGWLPKVKQKAEKLKNQTQEYTEFTQQVIQLAENFEVKKLQQFLENCQTESEINSQEFEIPSLEEMEFMYELARLGNMRKIKERAIYLENLDRKYIPFAKKLTTLAQEFKDQDIICLIEKYMPNPN
ncbi:MAG: ATP-binding protein [Cyanobacteria bacterium J06592_8]